MYTYSLGVAKIKLVEQKQTIGLILYKTVLGYKMWSDTRQQVFSSISCLGGTSVVFSHWRCDVFSFVPFFDCVQV